jgi:hypothetical protein
MIALILYIPPLPPHPFLISLKESGCDCWCKSANCTNVSFKEFRIQKKDKMRKGITTNKRIDNNSLI